MNASSMGKMRTFSNDEDRNATLVSHCTRL